ncbi:hypothetical protein BDV18DRAFT_14913 [Aspergillus unguis]
MLNDISRFEDPHPSLSLSVSIQNYYEAINSRTKVLAASLTSDDEIFALAGTHHITIAPDLLQELANPMPDPFDQPGTSSQFDSERPSPAPRVISYLNDEAGYRAAFARADEGSGEAKLEEALKIFSDKQRSIMTLFAEGA